MESERKREKKGMEISAILPLENFLSPLLKSPFPFIIKIPRFETNIYRRGKENFDSKTPIITFETLRNNTSKIIPEY